MNDYSASAHDEVSGLHSCEKPLFGIVGVSLTVAASQLFVLKATAKEDERR